MSEAALNHSLVVGLELSAAGMAETLEGAVEVLKRLFNFFKFGLTLVFS